MFEGIIVTVLVTLILYPLKLWQDKVNKEMKENDDSKKDNIIIDTEEETKNNTKLNTLINSLENRDNKKDK